MKQRQDKRTDDLSHEEKDQRIEELEHKLKLAEERVEQLKKLRDFDRVEGDPYPGPRGDILP